MGSNRILIRLNTGAPDGSLFQSGMQHSMFKYQPWQVIADKVRDIQRNLLTTNVAFGQKVSLELDKTGTLAEDVKVDITIGAIVGAGVGTFARVCDYGGLALVPGVVVSYQQNTIQQYDSQCLFIENARDHDITHRQVFDAGLGGRLTVAQRNTRATAAQTFRTYLKPYWYMLYGHCPILTALANKLKLTLTLAAPQDFIQTDFTNGATTTLQSVQFQSDVINTVGVDREDFSKATFVSRGLSYLFQDVFSTGYFKVPAGSTKFTNDLKGLVLPFTAIYAGFQKDSDVSVPYSKKPFELNPQDLNLITKSIFRDGANTIFEELDGMVDYADRWQKFHSAAQWRFPLISYSPSEIADLKNVNLGSFDAANINNFQHYMEFNAPLPVDYQIFYVFIQHNWVNHQGGELQTVFH